MSINAIAPDDATRAEVQAAIDEAVKADADRIAWLKEEGITLLFEPGCLPQELRDNIDRARSHGYQR